MTNEEVTTFEIRFEIHIYHAIKIAELSFDGPLAGLWDLTILGMFLHPTICYVLH